MMPIPRRLNKILRPLVVFIIMQFAWLTLVALWIYFYISNHIIIVKVGDQLSPGLMPGTYHVLVLVFGCVLLALLQIGFYFIYIYLNRQININRLQDQFISNITHELNSPLASIQLYLETLESRNVPEKKRHEFIQLMIKEVNRLQGMIDKVLGTIIIDQKQLAFNFKVYNMRTIIPLILKEVFDKYPSHIAPNVRLNHAVSCRCVLDKTAFKIIFINLIDNAIKYAGNDFSLNITTHCSEKYFVTDFQDAGVGIPPGEQKRIFRKFYRVYRLETPSVKGTGLGLYIVKEIIKLHGGKIRAVSNGKNTGSTIRIELPIYKETKKRFTNQLLKQTIKRKKRSERSG
jgi:two-component system phosphate regulon sensor histidine kinase PhoR